MGFAQAGEAAFGRLFAVLHTQLGKGSHSQEEDKAYGNEREMEGPEVMDLCKSQTKHSDLAFPEKAGNAAESQWGNDMQKPEQV